MRARGSYFAGRCGAPTMKDGHARHCHNPARGNGRCRVHQPTIRPCDAQQACAFIAAWFALIGWAS